MIDRNKLRINLICIYCSDYPYTVKIRIKNLDNENDMRAGNIDTGHDIGRIDKVRNLHKFNTPASQIKLDLEQYRGSL